jgi:hypothetical protein
VSTKVVRAFPCRTTQEGSSKERSQPHVTREEPPKQSSTIAALKQCLVWTREMPRIVRGLVVLGWPLRWHMAGVFTLNLLIAVWETSLASVVAFTITALSPEALNGPFFIILLGLAYPAFACQLPTGVILPWLRDLYATKKLWPHLDREFVQLGVPPVVETRHMREPPTELRGNTTPVAREGRSAAYWLTGMLVGDLPYVIRGLVVLVILFIVSPLLATLLVGSMLVDLWITLHMDMRGAPLYATQKDCQLIRDGLEVQVRESVASSALKTADRRMARRVTRASFLQAADKALAAFQAAECCRINWQYSRALVSRIFNFSIIALVAFWVYQGHVSLAMFLFFTDVSTRACEPLARFLGFQSVVMANKELLRRLGLLANVDFGIKSSK